MLYIGTCWHQPYLENTDWPRKTNTEKSQKINVLARLCQSVFFSISVSVLFQTTLTDIEKRMTDISWQNISIQCQDSFLT